MDRTSGKAALLKCVCAAGLLGATWFAGYFTGAGWGKQRSAAVFDRRATPGLHQPARVEGGSIPSPSTTDIRSKGLADPNSRKLPFSKRVTAVLREPNLRSRQELLATIIDELPPSEYPAVVDLALQLDDTDRIQLLSLLVARWSPIDRVKAAEVALTQSNYWHGEEVIQSAMGTWAVADQDGALAWMRALPEGEQREKVLVALVTTFSRSQPQLALELLDANPRLKDEHLSVVLGQLALQDPRTAMALAEELPIGKDGDRAAGAAMWVLGKDDPAAALAWASALSDPERRKTAFRSAFAAWASESPDDAKRSALALAPGEEQDVALAAVVNSTAREDPAQAMEMIAKITGTGTRDLALQSLSLSLIDGIVPQTQQAASAIEAMAPGYVRDRVTRWVANKWANADPGAALEWVTAQPLSEGRVAAIQSVVSAWGKHDPRSALGWLLKHEPPTGESSGTQGLVGNWLVRNESEALTYLRSLPDGKAKDLVLADALQHTASRGAAPRAAELFATTLSVDAQRRASAGVATSWSESDPAAAADWAANIGDPQASARACEVVAAAWAQRDLVKTTVWLDRLPAGPARDAAIASFASVASGVDAHGALEWAGAVADRTQRDKVMEKMLQSWVARDQAAARAWLSNSSTVAKDVRDRILAFRP